MPTKASNVLLLARETCGSARSATAAAMNILVIVFIHLRASAQVVPYDGLLILVGRDDLLQFVEASDKHLTRL